MKYKKNNLSTIVAEISRNWTQENKHEIQHSVSRKFENVIEVNLQRGYKLDNWKFNTIVVEGEMNETIIAVFTKIPNYKPNDKKGS